LTDKVTFQQEKISDCYAEAADLLIRNYQESAPYKDFKLNPDMTTYLRMEANGQVLLTTARLNGTIIGYVTTFLLPNPHYRVLQAYGDLYYVHPKHRNGTGMKLLRFAEDLARKKGAVVASNYSKPDGDALFERMGYNRLETVYVKRLDHA
jgi:hypothetical protein